MTLNISSIIITTKKDFIRERASVIDDFLKNHDDSVVISYINKSRGDSIKFYYIENNKKVTSDYVLKNAKILINALLKNGAKLYVYNNGAIKEYTKDF